MISELLPSLRNLRVALITGGLIIGSLYILFGQTFFKGISITAEASDIVHLAPIMPHILLAMLCMLGGSLYMTALEGAVDWIHRKTLFSEVSEGDFFIKKHFLWAVAPLSLSASRRIEIKSERYFDSYRPQMQGTVKELDLLREKFKKSVMADILWLEGKLVGTPQEGPHDRYRAEGELRLGIALVLPLTAAATAHSISMSKGSIITTTLLVSILALKLAHYGLYYIRRSHSFLAHHVSDGTVLTPAMENLKSQYSSAN